MLNPWYLHSISSQIFFSCIIIGIIDGVLHNEAFRHTGEETGVDSWTHLIKRLRLWDDLNTYELLQFLRHRFVTGAFEWLSGKHDSERNDKDVLGYTDQEWEDIWTPMLEDGAWAVPHLTDSKGKYLKENNAPEMLIKFIAHDLRAHIIVFDLHLQTMQFISGNHLKKDNVLFDSPLLLYATGSHFQSVFQRNHEYFIQLAKDLESNQENSSKLRGQEKVSSSNDSMIKEKIATNLGGSNKNLESDFELRLKEIKKIKAKDRPAELQKEYNTLMRKRNRASASQDRRNAEKEKNKGRIAKIRKEQSNEQKEYETKKNKDRIAKIRKEQSNEPKRI